MGSQSATLTREPAKRAKQRAKKTTPALAAAPEFAVQSPMPQREFTRSGGAGALASVRGIPVFAPSERAPATPLASLSLGLPIQRKLAIGAVNDPLEAEADRVAEQVMRMPAKPSAAPAVSNLSNGVQRNCACGGTCSKCQEKQPEQKHAPLQMKSVGANTPTGIPAPPIVHEVLRSPGQPLDAATRAFVEPRFGHYFSSVRVHTDVRAAESAQEVNALAYASGACIVFDTRQYAPQTSVGMRLLVHELAHVVQQRSPAPLTGGASGLLDSDSGPACPRLQRQTPPPSPQPFIYETDQLRVLELLPPGRTLDQTTTLLEQEKKKGKITNFGVAGKVGSVEKIFLLNVILLLSEKIPWGTQTNLVTAIGWPRKPGDPAPKGLVTLRIDSKGGAMVELISSGPLPGISKQTTAAELKAAFKLAAVKDDGTAHWAPDELNTVAAAFAMLPPDDKGALEGVELTRVNKIPAGRTGEFESSTKIASDPAAVTVNPVLRLSENAFPKDEPRFFGGGQSPVPGSFQVILHEVGHAVETEVYRSKWKAHAQALADVHTSGEEQESDQRKREVLEEKIKTAKDNSTKKRWQKELDSLELQLAERSEKAANKKIEETKLKEKRAEVERLDAGPTERLKKFLDLVKDKKIQPFTTYAKKEWPGNPKDFYAEAYSLWLVDPEFLRTNYIDVYNFFQNGDYRK
jgi:Domain of unknown function (DUF4157)